MISQKELFDRLADLETQKLTLGDDIRQLKADSKYDEETNPRGLSSEDIKLIAAAAKNYKQKLIMRRRKKLQLLCLRSMKS